jgi:hypothetical protein
MDTDLLLMLLLCNTNTLTNERRVHRSEIQKEPRQVHSKNWTHVTCFIVKHESVPLVNMFYATCIGLKTAKRVIKCTSNVSCKTCYTCNVLNGTFKCKRLKRFL